MAKIEQFKSNIKEKVESTSQLEDSGIVYQLNYRPDQARLQQLARVSELESRIHRLENVLGASDEKLLKLTNSTTKDSLLETVQYLSATASLLDSSQLDHIEGRLTALAQKLDSIAAKKKAVAIDEEKDKMVCSIEFSLR